MKTMGRARFEKLLTPGYIGPVKTRNRIIKTGAAMLYCRENELHMNGRMMAFHEAIAKGSVGLLIVESPTIDYPLGARWRQRYRLDDDKYIRAPLRGTPPPAYPHISFGKVSYGAIRYREWG